MNQLSVQTESINIQQIAIDSMNLLQLNQSMIEKLTLTIKEMQPKVELYNKFLDAKGEVDCAIAADAVELYYIEPSGKRKKMGRDYFIQLLVIDGIIYNSGSGYKLYSSHKDYGRTKPTERNGYIRHSVLFNSKGLDYLVRKYKDDNRLWKAIDGQLYCGDN